MRAHVCRPPARRNAHLSTKTIAFLRAARSSAGMFPCPAGGEPTRSGTTRISTDLVEPALLVNLGSVSSAGRTPDAQLKVAVVEVVIVSVNEPVCPLIEYVPDATNMPVSFSVMTLPATWPLPVKRLLLMFATVKPACALATVSTRASIPVMLTLLPLTVPVRISDAS